MDTVLTAWNGTVCPQCGGAAEGPGPNLPEPRTCPHCGASFIAVVFPAGVQESFSGRYGEPMREESEAACFYHADKRAETACDSCGRFLCGLCILEVRAGHYCPQCLEQGIRSGALPEFQAAYLRHDLLALAMACLPFMLAMPILLFALPWETEIALGFLMALLIFPAFVTAPAALFLAFRFRTIMTHPLGRRTGWFPLTVLLTAVQMAVWAVAFAVFVDRLFSEW